MDYVLTEHARDALEKRNIQIVWMEQVLSKSELIEADPMDSDLEHRFARLPQYGNRVLHVILNNKKIPPHIVTVFFDRRRNLP